MEQLNKFQILRRLGGGATADVYLALDTFQQKQVALKVLKADLLRDETYAGRVHNMFMNEARLVRELQHPYIMGILDAVQTETSAYLVLEYVDGEPLSNHIKPDTLLPMATVLQIAFKCCMAMAYASARGLVHRDLKPENIMLTKSGDIKISDFGASHFVNSQTTQLTGMVGSPSYMSPEQIAERELDARSDMFSLGVMLYEMLTGERPFQSDNLMTLMFHISNHPHVPLRTRRPLLPSTLERLIDVALQKDPRQRFPTWQNFADQLSVIDSALTPEQEEYSDREKFIALRKNPFFHSFNDPQIWQTLRAARWHRLRVGKVLMEEGKAGNSFSILIYGEVNVSKHGNHISRLKAGASLGEMAFLKPDQPLRTATITAATQVVAVKFTRAALEHAGADLRAKFEQRFLEILVERLSITSEKLAEVQT